MSSVTVGNVQFNVVNKLGAGSYGVVYKILKDGKEYALKVIDNKANEGIKSLREVDIMSRLYHPCLTHAEKIYTSYSSEKSQIGIMMEIANTDLLNKNKDPFFTQTERLKCLYDVCQGLQYLHSSGYLHLDIKPLNILYFDKNNSQKDNSQKDKSSKLTDFGLSLIMEKKNGKKFKYFPLELVTIDHRAPEIFLGGTNYNSLQSNEQMYQKGYIYNEAVDIWALGITFIETLSEGKSLFMKEVILPDGKLVKEFFNDQDYTSQNVMKIYEEKLSKPNIRKTLDLYLSFVPKERKQYAIDLIERMLDFNPNNRPNINEILTDKLFSLFNFNLHETNLGFNYSPEVQDPYFCNENVVAGFNAMIKAASRIEKMSLETIFLAGDFYQRILASIRVTKVEEELTNCIYASTLALYMAIKMIESYFADSKLLAELTGDAVDSEYILNGEAIIVQSWKGLLYRDNLFNNSNTLKRLKKGYQLLSDCNNYRFIDLLEWKKLSEQESKVDGVFEKYIEFKDFLLL